MNESKSPWRRPDIFVALTVAMVTALTIRHHVDVYRASGQRPHFYQEMFAPAVSFACGHGFKGYGEQTTGFPKADAFLADAAEELPCDAVGPAPSPLNVMQSAHRYLILLTGIVWRVTGVSWAQTGVVAAALAAPVGAFVYLLFRAVMPLPIALIFTLLALLSPVHLTMAPQLRDYAKAPYFLFTLFMVAWLVRAEASRRLTMGMLALAGAVLGIGFGMRTDVALYFPVILVVLVALRPGYKRADLITKAAAAAVAVLAFLSLAWPVMRTYQNGDNFAHVSMLGLTEDSRDWLGLNPPAYSFGYRYDDGYQVLQILARADRQGFLHAPVGMMSREYSEFGNSMYRQLVESFPADVVARGVGATVQVFALPFHKSQLTIVGDGWPLRWAQAVRQQLARFDGELWGPVLLLLFLSSLCAAGWRFGAAGAIACLPFTAITAVQFQGRHYFHLEVLPFLAAGALASATLMFAIRRTPPGRQAVVRGCAAFGGMVILILATVQVSRAFQKNSVGALLESYASAPSLPVEYQAERVSEANTLLRMSLAVSSTPHFIDSNALVVRLSSEKCNFDMVALTFRYHVQAPYPDLSRSITLAVPRFPETTEQVFPIFTPGQRWRADPAVLQFAGIELPHAQVGCIESVRKFSNPDAFPMLLETTLRPGWEQEPLYETIRRFERPIDDRRFLSYTYPEELTLDRPWLASLAPMPQPAGYQSAQVEHLDASRIELDGRPVHDGAYLVSWPDAAQPAGTVWFVEGELLAGGLTVGLQSGEKWVQQISIDRPGRFRAAVRVDQPGAYGAVLANHQLRANHRSVITRYGWLQPR